MDAIQRSRQLYEDIDFSKLVITEVDKYVMAEGKIKCDVVFNNNGVEIMHCVAEDAVIMTAHVHNQVEHFILYDGDAVITINGADSCLQKSLSVSIPPQVPHSVSTKYGFKMLVMLIPAPEKVLTNG